MNTTLEIIAQMETLLGELKNSLGVESSKRQKGPPKEKTVGTFSGLTGSVYSLVEEGFFKEPKTISEIQNKLRLDGVVTPTTSLSGPLLQLIRKKILGRNKPESGKGTFRYQQR